MKTIPSSKRVVLGALAEASAPMTIKDLERVAANSSKTLYVVVKDLTRWGWVAEEKLPGLGGPRGYSITPKGRAEWDRIPPLIFRYLGVK